MSNRTFLDYVNDNSHTQADSMTLSVISILNNLLSAGNNYASSEPNKTEIERATILAMADLIGVAGDFLSKNKIGKGLQITSWLSETTLIADRLFSVNIPNYHKYRDFHTTEYAQNKGYIPIPLILDIISDTTTLAKKFSEAVSIFSKTFNPIAIGLNIFSALLVQVSNSLNIIVNNNEVFTDKFEKYINSSEENRIELKELWSNISIHKDDFSFSQIFTNALNHVLTNETELVNLFKQITEQIIPSQLNPFDTPKEAELIGDEKNNTIKANVLFDDPYLIMGYDGNDILMSGDKNGYIDGGKHNDILQGNSGNDQLSGGQGNDTLNGGKGNDTLVDESGYDHYYIQDHDIIHDLDGEGRIYFNQYDLSKLEFKFEGENLWRAFQGNKVLFQA